MQFPPKSTGYGRAFRSKDEIFRIVAINPNRTKCPINVERVADGRGFNFPTDNVAMRLSSVHARRIYTFCSFKSSNMQLRAPYPKWEIADYLLQGDAYRCKVVRNAP